MNAVIDFISNIKPVDIVLLAAGGFFLLSCSVLIAIWVYKDAVKRAIRPLLWVIVILLVNPLLGLACYLLIGRSEEKLYCQNCGYPIHRDAQYCERCGGRKDKCANLLKPSSEAVPYGYLLGAGAAFILAMLCMGLLLFILFYPFIRI